MEKHTHRDTRVSELSGISTIHKSLETYKYGISHENLLARMKSLQKVEVNLENKGMT